MPSNRSSIWIALLLTTLSGCTVTPRAVPIHTSLPENVRDSAGFWAVLAEQPIATNDDALHAILLFLDDVDDSADYASRVESLRSRGVLPKNFNALPDEAISRGTVAVAMTNMLGIRGGLTMSLIGPNARYAIRELEFRQLFPPSTPNQILTGGEFTAVIDRVYSYVAGDPAQYPAAATREEMKGKGRIVVAHKADMFASVVESSEPSDDVQPAYLSIVQPSLSDALTLSQRVPGSQPATEPATAPAGTFVVARVVAGRAQVRLRPDDKNYVPCVVGMTLEPDSEICTDPKGMVWIETQGKLIRGGGTTVMRVGTLKADDGKVSTQIDMKHGTENLDFDSGGPTGDATLRSPNDTLAVRGTKVSLYDQPGFESRATSLTGTAEFENFRRQRVLFGKLGARVGSGDIVVTSDNTDPASVVYQETVVDPTLRGARTDSEQQLVDQLLSRSAVVSFDRTSGLLIVRGGSVPTSFTSFVQGSSFAVVLTWTSNVNLNLGLASPGDQQVPPRPAEFVYPSAGLARTPNGGATRFDHRGGSQGGYEVASFTGYDNSAYTVVVENINPNSLVPVAASIQVFFEGERSDFTVDPFPGNSIFVPSGDAFAIAVPSTSPKITSVDQGDQRFPKSPFSFSSAVEKRPPLVAGPVRPPVAGPARPPVAGPTRKTAKR